MSIIGRKVKTRVGRGVVVCEGLCRSKSGFPETYMVRMHTGPWKGRKVTCNSSALTLEKEETSD